MTRVAETLSQMVCAPAGGASAFPTSPEWFASWDAAYLRPDQRGMEVGGLALLEEAARLGPLRYRHRRSRTNVHTAMYDASDATALATLSIEGVVGGVDVATVEYLPEDAAFLAKARGWRTRGGRIEPHAIAPAADCRVPYAEWLGRRSKRVRTRWPKLETHVLRTLGMRFESRTHFPDLPGLLGEMFAVERAGWKGRNGTAIADSASDTLFYTALATRAAAAGALRVALLLQEDRITAFELGIVGDRRLYLLKVGYDEVFEDASIGHVLAALNIRHCCDDPQIDWYDKLGNGMTPAAYKLRFADSLDPLYRVTLYAPTWRGQLIRAADAARPLAKRLRNAWRARKKSA